MENVTKLMWDAGNWCCIRHEDTTLRYYLALNDSEVYVADGSGHKPSSVTIGEVPEEVLREFMLWRLSKGGRS